MQQDKLPLFWGGEWYSPTAIPTGCLQHWRLKKINMEINGMLR